MTARSWRGGGEGRRGAGPAGSRSASAAQRLHGDVGGAARSFSAAAGLGCVRLRGAGGRGGGGPRRARPPRVAPRSSCRQETLSPIPAPHLTSNPISPPAPAPAPNLTLWPILTLPLAVVLTLCNPTPNPDPPSVALAQLQTVIPTLSLLPAVTLTPRLPSCCPSRLPNSNPPSCNPVFPPPPLPVGVSQGIKFLFTAALTTTRHTGVVPAGTERKMRDQG